MKRLLLVMPNYYGFDEVVYEGLIAYSGYEVYKLNYDVGFNYSNYWQRIHNFIYKIFLGKNIKDNYKEAYFVDYLDSLGPLDTVVFNRPDILPTRLLDQLTSQIPNSKLILWDSLAKIPMDEGILRKVKNVFSFDDIDCESFGFTVINNFHFDTLDNKTNIVHDAIFLGTLDNRIADLELLLDYIATTGLEARAFLHLPKGRTLKRRTDIEVLKGIVPFKHSVSFARKSKVIIDLAHEGQTGLSFRFFEAMGLRKKVITTNTAVRKYDFFNESNIFVIDDIKKISIPSSFWNEDYEELSKSILEKYSLKQWVQKIVE